jgi:hypothetical protein
MKIRLKQRRILWRAPHPFFLEPRSRDLALSPPIPALSNADATSRRITHAVSLRPPFPVYSGTPPLSSTRNSIAGKGDLWNALRGQVVETAKHQEVWKEMDKYEKDKQRDFKRGKEEEKDEGRTRDPKTGVMMSGAQMRNARNAEGSVDWK